MVTVADELTDSACRHLCVLLSQVHRHLTHLHQFTLATLAKYLTLLDMIMLAYLL